MAIVDTWYITLFGVIRENPGQTTLGGFQLENINVLLKNPKIKGGSLRAPDLRCTNSLKAVFGLCASASGN